MKSFLTILVIAGLAGGVVIGLLTMGAHGDCVASYAAGAACPFFDVMAYIGMHADFVRNFSEAPLITVLVILFGTAFLIRVRFSADDFNSNKKLFINESGETDIPAKYGQIRWLSLFENSPNTA